MRALKDWPVPDHVTIDQGLIDQGVRNDPARCPLALAIKRALVAPSADGARVYADRQACSLTMKVAWVSWQLSFDLSRWVSRFDAGHDVKPITADLGRPRWHSLHESVPMTRAGARVPAH